MELLSERDGHLHRAEGGASQPKALPAEPSVSCRPRKQGPARQLVEEGACGSPTTGLAPGGDTTTSAWTTHKHGFGNSEDERQQASQALTARKNK